VAEAIHEKPYDEPATARQIDYGISLSISVDQDSKGVASAKIEDRLHDLNMAALTTLKLTRGESIRHTSRFMMDGVIHEHVTSEVVSSISASGRVFFRGMGCKSGWPANIQKEANKTRHSNRH